MIYIEKKVIKEIKNYSHEKYPKEAAGLLVSKGDKSIIQQFIPMSNISQSEDTFTFDPKAFVPLYHKIVESEQRLIGVIHSHPRTRAYPSLKDINQWYYNELSYWIYSVKEDTLHSFKINHNHIVTLNYSIR